jgi:nitrogen fixation/metabolism regulation signal transduction histidine kinase
MSTSTSTAPTPAPAAKPIKYKRSIKNYLLDPRFQLKWTGMIILVAFVISAIMGVFLYRTSSEVTAESQKVIAQGDELIKESQKNSDLVKMQIKKEYAESPELAETFNKGTQDLDKQLEDKHKMLLAQQAATVQQQRTMLMSLVAGLALLVVLIGVLGIYFTHKVVGPIYKMKLLLKQVGDGKLNFYGKLRKGDELQDFFVVFEAMVEKLKNRQRGEVKTLESAMEEAKASGASDEAIAKIKVVRDEMAAALEV